MLEAREIHPCFPDYKDSILNLSCSILNHYGIKPQHDTLSQVDYLLTKNYKHVVVILLDGLGMNVLENNLTYRDFLRRHLLMEYSSVFPPTTTASTVSFLSGLSPIEHGWLGWDMYFEQEKNTVCCFKNTLQGTETPAADYNVAKKYFPYKDIIDQINEKGTARANAIYSFDPAINDDFDKWFWAIKKSCTSKEQTFTYAYWDNPDRELHHLGSHSNDVYKMVRQLNASMVSLCESTKDTLFLITADHGHIDITNEFLSDYPEITKMLVRPVSIEARAMNFFVKPEFHDVFADELKKCLGQDFLIYTKDQILKEELFGPGEPHPNLTGLGDFIAIAVSYRTVLWDKTRNIFRSHHAGLTKEEMRIPIIWYVKKSKKVGLLIYYSIITMIVAFILYILFN